MTFWDYKSNFVQLKTYVTFYNLYSKWPKNEKKTIFE